MYSRFRFSRFRFVTSRLLLCLVVASALAVAGVWSVTTVFCQSRSSKQAGEASAGGGAARGKYIVEGVARCEQCHTPVDSNGNPDETRRLQGAPIRWVPAVPDSNWPLQTPRIGGVPLPASDDDMVKLLMTGIWTNGEHLRAPMPQFRMERQDAEAVVAYLKSLTAQK